MLSAVERGHKAPTVLVLDRIATGLGDPERELDAAIQECYLGQALASLPESYRQIVLLRLGEGRSSEEVARLLGTTVDSVKSKLRRARKLLREQLLERRTCPVCQQMGAFKFEVSGKVE